MNACSDHALNARCEHPASPPCASGERLGVRLFFAFPVPPDVARGVERATATLSSSVPGVRWVSPAHMHLTMKFLGARDEGDERGDHDVARLARAAREAVASIAPFDAFTGAPGAFPNFSRPRVVWLGMEPSAPFAAIAERLEHELSPLGYPPEGRAFSAHLTLGRIARALSQVQRDALQVGLARAFGIPRESGSTRDTGAERHATAARRVPAPRNSWTVPVRELVLFSSSHVRGALRYDPLQSIPLGAR